MGLVDTVFPTRQKKTGFSGTALRLLQKRSGLFSEAVFLEESRNSDCDAALQGATLCVSRSARRCSSSGTLPVPNTAGNSETLSMIMHICEGKKSTFKTVACKRSVDRVVRYLYRTPLFSVSRIYAATSTSECPDSYICVMNSSSPMGRGISSPLVRRALHSYTGIFNHERLPPRRWLCPVVDAACFAGRTSCPLVFT